MQLVSLPDLAVLMIEPSGVQQTIIRRLLGECGVCLVRSASSGSEALSELARERPDVVISSFYLGDMTGADLIMRLRNAPDPTDVAFILASSETSFHLLDPLRQAGVAAMVAKPFERDDLYQALQAALAFVNASEDDDQMTDFESLRVLAVDDTKVALKFMIRTLRRLGIQDIAEACDGVEATALMRDRFFDLVVTDYNMPKMDGRELVAHIRGESNQRSVPIIMVTSEEHPGRLAAVHQAGVSAICDKPFEFEHMRQLIDQLVTR